MAIAVIKHDLLLSKAKEVGFPTQTKVKCESGLNGYYLWDRFIQANVQWVSEIEFDAAVHVKIGESASFTGELKKPWELTCQKFLEGSAESNTFNRLDLDEQEVFTHVNRQAIQVLVSLANHKYKVDFETEPDGSVVTRSALAVAIFEKPEDTSLTYTSELEVAQLWTTKVEVFKDDTEEKYTLFQRAYANDPTIEESYPWIVVGDLTTEEYQEWKIYNTENEVSLEHLADRAVGSLEQAFETASPHQAG